MVDDAGAIAQRIRAALSTADLDAFADLLDLRVTWGAPGDPTPLCQNREQVLVWYRHGHAEGRRARNVNVVAHGNTLLVSMTVTAPKPTVHDVDADRWQVLTPADGRVTDIRGYDDEGAARAWSPRSPRRITTARPRDRDRGPGPPGEVRSGIEVRSGASAPAG
jgi:ketosteroid isomerase-like protein